ncbi:MAG: helix-turn-helix transcriptional regulator [Candidatus Methylumidiphilus sp.]
MTALYDLPMEGYSRLSQILGKPQAEPPIPPLIPVEKSTWYDGIKTGRFPAPVYCGRSALWKNRDLIALMERLEKGELAQIAQGRGRV